MEFKSLKTLCIFIGYPYNNNIVYGRLLDVLPNVAINCHTSALDLLYKNNSASKNIVFALLVKCRDYLTRKNYQYEVPKWFQGKCNEKTVEVIGDCLPEVSLKFIGSCPTVLELLNSLDIDVKFVHLIRNPFDNIAAIAKRQYHEEIEIATVLYFKLVKMVLELKENYLGKVYDVHHRSFTGDPMVGLMSICDFLEVETTNYYLEECAKSMLKVTENLITRNDLRWKPEHITEVQKRCKKIEFLKDYQF